MEQSEVTSPFPIDEDYSKLFPNAETLLETQRSRQHWQAYYMENFLVGQIQEQPELTVKEEIETVHRLFPIWRSTQIFMINQRKEDDGNILYALSTITLEECATFALRKYSVLKDKSEQLFPGTSEQINASLRMGYWGRVYDVVIAANKLPQ